LLPQSQRKLTAKELAAKLGCSVSTVYRLKLAGRLEYAQPGGKGHMVRFDEDCLNLKSNGSELPESDQAKEHTHSGPKPKWLTEYEGRSA